jgi:dolichol-phosphate mannosyltransferase
MKNIDWAKRGIFSFSNSPLALLSTGGMLLLLISIMMILTFIALRVLFPDQAPEGATSILVSIFTFGALNILAIGIVGEYIGKILIEVKQRPRLIRESIIKNGEEDHLNDIL